MELNLRQAVRAAAGREEVRAAIHALYSRVQQEIDLRRPICRQSGRCCRFDEFGHRLYVTTMELAAFVAGLEAEKDSPAPPSHLPLLPANPGGCRFQVDGLCSVHPIRPFGCRIFFCDPTAEQWQQEQYEQFHQQLRGLHEQLNVPYFYMEWRKALGECV
jgi:Fe-S-cluster containining protein